MEGGPAPAPVHGLDLKPQTKAELQNDPKNLSPISQMMRLNSGGRSPTPSEVPTPRAIAETDMAALEERMGALITRQVDALSAQLSKKIDLVAKQLAGASPMVSCIN